MKANRLLLATAGTLLCLTSSGWAKDELPKTQKFARYEPMVKRSPFAIATANAPIPSAPDFAKDLYIANAAHSPDGDFVTIASTTDKNLKEYLSTRETVRGYSISNIQWSDKVGETKVTISKDGQFATLTFNEALLSQAIQNAPPTAVQPPPAPGGPARGVANNPQVPIQRPMAVPQIPTPPPPHVRPTIRRKGTPQTPVQQAQPQPEELSEDDLDIENH
ncbi:MAG: hypothetical protein M3429_01145 [Verrucomicrobiota bacterium]|nr:hypothetical protein [Chthoniobacterales bacterium]MDQ3545118.1 hypothetical protein [Verrucomicrobiota bacterium]